MTKHYILCIMITNQKGDESVMDINSLLSMLLTSSNTNEISQKSGASQQDVGSVLTSALPMLLGGKSENSTAKAVSKDTGINLNTILSILTAAAPLLQQLLGGDSNSSSGGLAGLLGGLTSSASGGLGNLGSLVTNLFGGGSSSKPAETAPAQDSQPKVIKNTNKKTTAKTTTTTKKTTTKK